MQGVCGLFVLACHNNALLSDSALVSVENGTTSSCDSALAPTQFRACAKSSGNVGLLFSLV